MNVSERALVLLMAMAATVIFAGFFAAVAHNAITLLAASLFQ